jgi:hypothetical protein
MALPFTTAHVSAVTGADAGAEEERQAVARVAAARTAATDR